MYVDGLFRRQDRCLPELITHNRTAINESYRAQSIMHALHPLLVYLTWTVRESPVYLWVVVARMLVCLI